MDDSSSRYWTRRFRIPVTMLVAFLIGMGSGVPPADAQCVGNLVTNGDFGAGLTDWPTLTNTPQIATTNACDGTSSAQMWGNQVVGESIEQQLPGGGLQAGRTYRVSVRYRWLDINPTAPPHVYIRLAAFAADPTQYPPLGSPGWTDTTPTTTSATCVTHTFPDFTPSANLPWLTINPENSSTIDAPGEVSWGIIDDVCIQDVTPPPVPRCELGTCKAPEIKTSMVRAFEPCTAANSASVDGVPSCAPPQPLSDYGFAPACRGQCTTQLRARQRPCGPMGEPCCCVTVAASCQGVLAPDSSPANGTFPLDMTLRLTGNDPANGDMTLVDVPFSTSTTMVNGKMKVKAGCVGQAEGITLPVCTSAELVDLVLRDPDGDRFAVPGVSCCQK